MADLWEDSGVDELGWEAETVPLLLVTWLDSDWTWLDSDSGAPRPARLSQSSVYVLVNTGFWWLCCNFSLLPPQTKYGVLRFVSSFVLKRNTRRCQINILKPALATLVDKRLWMWPSSSQGRLETDVRALHKHCTVREFGWHLGASRTCGADVGSWMRL